MVNVLLHFERIARLAGRFSDTTAASAALHPFDTRDIYPGLPAKVRKLFDNGHYAEATFEAFKFIDRQVAARAKLLSESGFKLMMAAFNEDNPKIQLTPLTDTTEIDEQRGYKFLFAGGATAIRNPRGHKYGMNDDPDTCLAHLSFGSLLLRRLDQVVPTTSSTPPTL